MQRPERRGQSAATPPNLSFSYYEGPTCSGSRGGDFRLTLTLKREGSVLRTLCRTTGALGVALGLMVGAARTAVAQKQFAFFGMGGGYFASDLYTGVSGNKVELSDSWTYGARLVYLPQRQFGVELSYARAKSDATTRDPTHPLGDASVTLDQIDLSGLFAGQRGPATGYLSLGLGTSIVSPSVPNVTTESNWRFAWNVGIGVMFKMGRSLVGRIDGRYRGVDTDHATNSYAYCDVFGYCYGYASSIYWSGEVTAGLGFRF